MANQKLQTVHPFLEQLMEEHNCESLSALADDVGINRMTLSNWARKRPQHIDELERMCAIFKISPEDWIRGWTTTKKAKA